MVKVEASAMSAIARDINNRSTDTKEAIIRAANCYELVMKQVKEKSKTNEKDKDEKSDTINVNDIRNNAQRLVIGDIEGR